MFAAPVEEATGISRSPVAYPYTNAAAAPRFTTTTRCPGRPGGNFTPVFPAATVVRVFNPAVSCKAVAAVVPLATIPVCDEKRLLKRV